MILYLLLLAASGVSGRHGVEKCDLIELNHVAEFTDLVVTEDGTVIEPKVKRVHMTQFIFWEWNGEYRRYDVRGYMITPSYSGSNVDEPVLNKLPDSYTVDWFSFGKRYMVTAKLFRETWTQYDPERHDVRLTADGRRFRILPMKRDAVGVKQFAGDSIIEVP